MNACSACKHGKRKCTKSRPSCASCLRLGKTCVYTEDSVQTHFDVDAGTGHGGNSIDQPNHESMIMLNYGISRRKDRQGSSSPLAVAQMGKIAASPVTILTNSCYVDPFFKVPGSLSDQAHEAIDHIYRGSFYPLSAMRNCGMISRVRGTAAFYQLLAYSSWHLSILRNEKQSVFSLQHAAKASQELQKQISDPTTCTTVEMILAVYVFASSSAQMRDPKSAKVHIAGAQRMLKYRDNMRLLESDPWARVMLFWVETVSCSFTDLPVCVPIPTEYLTEYKRSNKQISQWIETNVVDPRISPVFSNPAAIRAINAIREVQIIIRSELYKQDVSQDLNFPSNHLLPIFHDLLAMINPKGSSFQEAFRLAAMVFVHELQYMYWGRLPPPHFLAKLHRAVLSPELNWSSQDPALFWILAVALTSNMTTPEQEDCFVRKFKHLLSANAMTDVNDLMMKLTLITWDYDVLKPRTEVLENRFEAITSNTRTAGFWEDEIINKDFYLSV